MSRVTLSWSPQEPPRRPAAVLGREGSACRLALAVHQRGADAAGLRVAAAPGLLLVVGDEADLPWADGATYLGREEGVLLPTTLAPSVPPDLLRQALRGRTGEADLVVVPGEVLVFAAAAGAPDPAWLLERARGRPA